MSRLATLIKAHNDHAYVNSPLGEFVPGFCGFSFTAQNEEEYFNTRRMLKSWCTDTPCANCLGSIAEDGEFDRLVQCIAEEPQWLNSKAGIERLEGELCPD